MIARRNLIVTLAPLVVLFSVALRAGDAAIVLFDEPKESLNGSRKGLDERLLSLPDAGMGTSKAIAGFQRYGIGQRGFEFRNDLEQFSLLLNQAGSAYSAGEFSQAEELLRAVLKQRRAHAGVELALADTLLRQDNFREAQRWVGEARLHGVKIDLADWLDAQCLFGLGQVGAARGLCEDLMTRGDTELAAAAFALLLRQGIDDDAPFADVETFLIGVLERTGKRALVLEWLVVLAMERKFFEAALKHANTWVDMAPSMPGGHLGIIHANRGLQKSDAVKQGCLAFIAQFPDRVEGYLLLADHLSHKGEHVRALQLLEAARGKVRYPEGVREAIMQVHLSAGDTEEALRQALVLLSSNPTDSRLWEVFLAALDRHLTEDKGAREIPMFSDEQGGASSHVEEAHKLGQQEKHALAARHMIRAIFSGEQTAGMFNDAGCLVAPVLGTDVATPFFRMALIVAPNYREASQNLAAVRAQSSQRQRGQLIEALTRQIAENGGTSFAENELGELLAVEGRIADAKRHFRRALDIDPTDARALLNLGQVQFRAGDLSRALRTVRLAVEHAGSWLEPAYRHSWLLLQQEEVSEDDLIEIVTRENRMINQDSMYYQALGRLLRAERYLLLKSGRLCRVKAEDCLNFSRDTGIPEIEARAQEILTELSARDEQNAVSSPLE